jgi:HEAT repeat protein
MSRFVTLFVALVLGVLAVVWYYRAPNAGPVSVAMPRNDRGDDKWLDGLQSRTPKDVEAATAELEQRGTAALPLIRTTLGDASAPKARRNAALKAAAILGPRSVEALPEVTAALQQPEYAPEAALALSYMGSPAVAPLRAAISADDPVVRREALRSLGKLRERASIDPQVVVPMLLDGLKDPDPSVRGVAVIYLGIVRDNPEKEVAGLMTALRDDTPAVREAAAVALSAYGAQAEPAVPALHKAESDPDDDVKREAGRALVIISEAKSKT